MHLHPGPPRGRPARTDANRTYPAVERHGLVWATLDVDALDDIPALDRADSPLPLRPLLVTAAAAVVVDELRGYGAAEGLRVAIADELRLRFTGTAELTLFVQPAGESHCVVRGVDHGGPPASGRIELLRRHHRLLCRVRDRVEAESPSPRPRTRPSSTGCPRRSPSSGTADIRSRGEPAGPGGPQVGSGDRRRRPRARRAGR